jgi:hypothetical protein
LSRLDSSVAGQLKCLHRSTAIAERAVAVHNLLVGETPTVLDGSPTTFTLA